MTKEEVFNILANIITHIGEDFNAEDREIYLDDQLYNKVPFEYSIDAGISKAVILIKGLSFVIKLPFFKYFGAEWWDEAHDFWINDRDTAIEEYAEKRRKEENNYNYILTREELDAVKEKFEQEYPEPQDNEFYYDIEGASNIDLDGAEDELSDWNYCATEVAIYQRAVEEGLENYFAQEEYLGAIDRTPVYWQARCIPMSEIEHDYNSIEYSKKKTSAKKTCDNLKMYCFNPIWIADFIDLYGEDELMRLHTFLKKYMIEDLRECNIGYLDGAPILFDYSGYRDW